MANKKRKLTLLRKIGQFFEYNVAGLAFFWVSYGVLLGLDSLGAALWFSSTVSYLIGLLVNFLLERYWVFRENKESSAFSVATKRYVAISLINLVLNYVILQSLDVLGVSIVIAPFISAAIFTPWNFMWYKFWVFAGEKKVVRRVAKKQTYQARKERKAVRKTRRKTKRQSKKQTKKVKR